MVVVRGVLLIHFPSSLLPGLSGDLNWQISGHKPAPLAHCLLLNLINFTVAKEEKKKKKKKAKYNKKRGEKSMR